LIKLQKKGLRRLLWVVLFIVLYAAYDHYERRQARLRQEEEQRQQLREREHQAVLDKQSRQQLESYRKHLETLDVGRSGKLVVNVVVDFDRNSKNSSQTLTMPFTLELDQELDLPIYRFKGHSARIKAYAEIQGSDADPQFYTRGGPAEATTADWSLMSDSTSYKDWSQLRFSLKPSPHSWGDTVRLSPPASMPRRRGYRVRLFLLAPSGETAIVAPDKSGVYSIKPAFSGLWRYLWFYFNPGQPARNVTGEQGMFFVELPSGRDQLAAAARQFYHRLSTVRDEQNEYQLNRLVRALAAYGRKGKKESAWVDEVLRLIRSREPQKEKTAGAK